MWLTSFFVYPKFLGQDTVVNNNLSSMTCPVMISLEAIRNAHIWLDKGALFEAHVIAFQSTYGCSCLSRVSIL